jgi:hypothetical protein
MYAPQSNTRKMMLKQKLYSMRLGKSMDKNICYIDSILAQLASLGEIVLNDELVTLTLGALPKSWKFFKYIIS